MHTPGPWYAVPDERPRHFEVHINPHGGYCITTIKTARRYAEQAMADAKLMAAAPELLTALEEIVNWYVPTHDWERIENLPSQHPGKVAAILLARAAIAKATGG